MDKRVVTPVEQKSRKIVVEQELAPIQRRLNFRCLELIIIMVIGYGSIAINVYICIQYGRGGLWLILTDTVYVMVANRH